MNYVYIDESGETGRQSKYIVFASITTTNHRSVEKAIKKIWRAKPHLHTLGELHAHAVDDSTRRRVLLTLNELNIAINHVIIDKQKTKQELNLEYYRVLAQFIESHNNANIVVIDRKDTNKKRKEIIEKLQLENIYKNVKFEESYKVKQLQAVDFVAWAIGRMHEQDDSTYVDIIKESMK